MTFKKGFTLLETLFALAVLTSALLLLVNSWAGSFSKVQKAQLSFEVAALLERKMGEFERNYRGKPLEEIKDEEEGDFGEDYPQYKWKMTSKALEFPDLSPLLMAQDGGADQMLLSVVKQLSEGIGKMAKELTLTLTYTTGKKSMNFSLTTYFVDYDKPLNFAAPAP